MTSSSIASSVTAPAACTASRASPSASGPNPASTSSALAASPSSPYSSTRGFPSAVPDFALQDHTERKPHPHPATHQQPANSLQKSHTRATTTSLPLPRLSSPAAFSGSDVEAE